MYDNNRPEPSILQIYYKIAEEGDPRNFDDIPYVLSNTDVTDNPDENRELFRKRTHNLWIKFFLL